ncbi:MAG: hypothetical protein M0Z30_17125 [Actinomycetota bacterium]|nr:hypothetical protein [Actinomycetota bacterium]
MGPPRVVVGEDTGGREALELLQRLGLPGAPVVDSEGTYLGTVEVARLERQVAENDVPVGGLADITTSTVAASATLDVGLEALTQAGGQWLAVTGGDRRVVGILSATDIVRGYEGALDASIHRFTLVSPLAVAVEETMGAGSPFAGRPIRSAGLPPGCVIVTVQRDGQRLSPTGDTVLEVGDVLSMFVPSAETTRLTAKVRGAPEPDSPEMGGESQMI